MPDHMSTVKGSNGSGVVSRRRIQLWVKGLPVLYRRATIDVLLDDVLLDVFDFYLELCMVEVDAWCQLVHVCRRTPVKKLLVIWPALPIAIKHVGGMLGKRGITNIDAALEHNDCVCQMSITCDAGPILNSMKQPFPALTRLWLEDFEHVPVLPDSFLGGSAPRLRYLALCGIPFPGLPKLLLSAHHHLVYLSLCDVPDSGFISPEVMVTCLSSLTNPRVLRLGFRSPRSRPHQTNRHWPPLARAILPSLDSLSFRGVSEYLEDVVARIDVPLLCHMVIRFFNQLIFDTPLLRSFISHTEVFKAFDRAGIYFCYDTAYVMLRREGPAHYDELHLGISCYPSEWQLSSLTELCNSSLPPFLPMLEHLEICEDILRGPDWQDNMEDIQWLELLHPFTSAKSLYLDKKLAPLVAPALKELVGERVIEVLPVLQNIFVQGPVHQAIEEFVAARQRVGHPVAVQDWDEGPLW